jgi:hypothetical protein
MAPRQTEEASVDPELTLWSIQQERTREIAQTRLAAEVTRARQPLPPARAARRAWFVRLLASSASRRASVRADDMRKGRTDVRRSF